MCADKKNNGPGYLWSVFHHKCSRCRTGRMFKVKNAYHLKHFMKMYDRCPACTQYFEIEPGFYYGTAYISYAITVALSVATFIGWWLLLGFSLEDNSVLKWIVSNMIVLILIQPYLMRLSRAIWLSFFVPYNANWQTEKPEDPERM
ncbi:MAG: DUF983 domain-containing protein [Bacteroidetes bacterium]|nr:DUF983 domain-containing protein [Bacteroidota bacterium]